MTEYHLASDGDDGADGALATPWASFNHAIPRLRGGDILSVGDGDYYESVNATARAGASADMPVKIQAEPGEHPLLHGLFKVTGADFFTLRRLGITWQAPGHDIGAHSTDWLVHLASSEHWRITQCEVFGAKSSAAVGVSGSCSDYRIDHNRIHDTVPSNGVNQDHLVYVQSPIDAHGVIERNLLYGSPNGRGIKIGEDGGAAVGGVEIAYNTLFDNLGPTNIQLSYGASIVEIHHNILVKSHSGYENIFPFELTGSGNHAHDNLGWASAGVCRELAGHLTDSGRDVFADPKFADLIDFVPTTVKAQRYGRYA